MNTHAEETLSTEKKELARVALKRRAVQRAEEEPFATSTEELKQLGEKFRAKVLDLARVRIPLRLLELIPRETAEQHCLLPVKERDDRMVVAMADPSNPRVAEEVEFVTGKRVVIYVAPEIDVREAIQRAYLAHRRGEDYFEGPRFAERRRGGAPGKEDQSSPREQESSPTADAVTSDRLDLGEPSAGLPQAEHGAEPPISFAETAVGNAAPSDVAITDKHPAQTSVECVDVETAIEIPDLDVAVVNPSSPRAASTSSASGHDDVFGDALQTGSSAGLELQVPTAASGAQQSAAASAAAGVPNERRPAGPPPRRETPATAPAGVALIVEDDAAIADMIKRLVERRHLKAVIAGDGEAAVLALKSQRPRLVILDAMLPKVHGFEVLRRMRASKTFREVPVIVVTAAHRGWEYAEDLKQTCGVNHYIEKPFRAARLLRAVDGALGKPPPSISPDAAAELEAGIVAFKEGQLDAAGLHLKEGLKLDPLAYELHFHLGLLHGKQGHAFDAISAIKQAVELNPDYFPAVKNLAILYLRAGFRRKSAEMWRRALSLAPDEGTRAIIQQKLDELR